jgi:hypothetical protein
MFLSDTSIKRPVFATMLIVERVSPSEKSIHGSSAAKEKSG